MICKSVWKTMVVVMTVAFVSIGVARAEDDDDSDCDNLQSELKKLAERVMNNMPDAKAVGPVCASTGQLIGIIKASREVAAECYSEGKKRNDLLASFDRAVKEMESKIGEFCK